MRSVLGALFRCAIWYVALFWTMTYLLGISRTVTAVAVPFIIVAGVSLGNRRFYRGIHRREGTAGQACFRGPVRRAGAAGPRCRAGHDRRACTCPRCTGPGLSQGQISRQITAYLERLENIGGLSEPLAGGIRLRYVPADPLSEGDLGTANLSAAVQYMRNFRASPGGRMTVRLYSGPPPGNNSGIVSGSGYTRGGQAPAHVRSAPMNQPPVPGPLPHPVTCQCFACMPVQPSGAVPGCVCPSCTPPGLVSVQANCSCPSCRSFRRLAQNRPWPTFAPGGIVPSLPAPTASQPPTFRSRPRSGGGMDGFDGAPLVAGTALGYRWWTLRAPQLHRSPASAGEDWDPGLLRGVKDFWKPGVNLARCLSSLRHPFGEVPHSDCACGYWAYWEIQQHDMGIASSLPVVGVVRASGQVIMGPRGFRAQKAEIVALHLPFKIQPDLPAEPPAGDPVTRMLRGQPSRSRISSPRPQRRFTGRVISFPGAPPVPPSLGGPSQPAPLPPLRPPPEPEPPTEEEIRAAHDLAEAWTAVIADRLETMYPGAEVCAMLSLMKAKYPVKSEYVPPESQVTVIPCPYCGTPCDATDIHMHVVNNHYF